MGVWENVEIPGAKTCKWARRDDMKVLTLVRLIGMIGLGVGVDAGCADTPFEAALRAMQTLRGTLSQRAADPPDMGEPHYTLSCLYDRRYTRV